MSKREDIFEKLDNLIEQNQFELVSDKVDDNRLKVIYLMNDAVESFIVFENARITGEYIKDYQGEINTSLTVQKNDSTGNDEYVLVVHQKDSVCTVFFEDVSFEVNLYNYGRTAHFWIEGYECLRKKPPTETIMKTHSGQLISRSTEMEKCGVLTERDSICSTVRK